MKFVQKEALVTDSVTLVTTSKALVTRSDALVPSTISSIALLCNRTEVYACLLSVPFSFATQSKLLTKLEFVPAA